MTYVAASGAVLVVDDEAMVRTLVTEVPEGMGYLAIEAADAAAGLRVLFSDAQIDLLITDVGLTGGMNGAAGIRADDFLLAGRRLQSARSVERRGHQWGAPATPTSDSRSPARCPSRSSRS